MTTRDGAAQLIAQSASFSTQRVLIRSTLCTAATPSASYRTGREQRRGNAGAGQVQRGYSQK